MAGAIEAALRAEQRGGPRPAPVAASVSSSTAAIAAATSIAPALPTGAAGEEVPIVCPGHSRPIAELSFSGVTPDGVFFVSACLDKQPMLRNGTTGDWIGTFEEHRGAVWSAKLSRSGLLCATGAADFSAKLWDAITGEVLVTYEAKHVVKCVDFNESASLLITGGHDKVLRVFDVASRAAAPVLALEHPTKIRKLVSLPHGLVATGDEEGSVRLWSLSDRRCLQTVTLAGEVRDLEFRPADSSLCVASGRHVLIFELVAPSAAADTSSVASASASASTSEMLREKFRGTLPFLARIDAASQHPHLDLVILGGGDAASAATDRGGLASLWVFLIKPSSGEIVSASKGHHGPIRCLRFSPDGEAFASGAEDGTIRLWRTAAQVRAGAAGLSELPRVAES